MATYYWVGGAGTWDSATITNWASSSGGAGNAGFPTSSDNVIMDANSGTGLITVTTTTGAVCNNFTWSGSASLTFSNSFSVFGNLVLLSSITGTPIMASTTTGNTITCNGFTTLSFIFNGIGGAWTLQDNLTCTNPSVFFQAGTLNLNGFTWFFSSLTVSTANTKIINGTGTLSCNAMNANTASNFSSTGNVSLVLTQNAGSNAVLMGTNAFNFFQVTIAGSAAYRFSGASCNFGMVSNSVSPATFRFLTDITVRDLALRGTAGNLVTISSFTAGTQRTITQTTGTVNGNYLSITDCNGAGGANFYAGADSTNNGNNAGWIFANAPWGQFLSF